MALSHRARLAWAGAVACLVTVGLSGCFAGDPTPSSTSPQSEATPTPTPTASIKVAALMTIASVDVDGKNVSMSGYVSGLVTDKGKCTFTATNQVTKASIEIVGTAVSNVTTTSCGTSAEPIGSFTKGGWSVELHFTSGTIDVTSEPLTLEIP